MDEQILFFENVSFIATDVPLTSTAVTLLNLMIVLSRSIFYADRHLSIKYQTDTQVCVRTYTALTWRHYACVRESLPYFPLAEYESRNLFHFPFSWWFQKSLAKSNTKFQEIKPAFTEKNSNKDCCTIVVKQQLMLTYWRRKAALLVPPFQYFNI